MTRRYAEDTKVPVARSQEHVKADLRRVGADHIALMEGSDQHLVVFKVSEILYRIASAPTTKAKNPEQETRRQWRAIALLVKAKTVSIIEGISSVEREFLADVVMPDGSTLADHSTRLIKQSYQEGGAPKMLMLGGPSSP